MNWQYDETVTAPLAKSVNERRGPDSSQEDGRGTENVPQAPMKLWME